MTDGVATSSARTPSEPLLVALDVDGTLMSYDQEMSDDVRDAVAALRDAGHHVVLASGRSLVAMTPVAEILGIDRTAECIANKAAAGLGMAPGVAAMFEDPACLVTMFVNGREMTADELRAPEVLEEIARDLRRLHDSGTELPTSFAAS